MKIVEQNFTPIPRMITGLYSFDRAWMNARHDVGFPLDGVLEIAGATHVGKSTIAYSLAAMLGKAKVSNVALLDLEGFDQVHVQDIMMAQGFENELRIIRGDAVTDENLGDELINAMRDPEKKPKGDYIPTNVGIFDSIGAISPIAEQSGELGEANMGRRAKLVAQFTRKYLAVSRNKGKNLIAINHLQQNMSVPGMHTPGGVTLEYLSAMRTRIKKKEEFKDGSYVIEGKVTKNRWGYDKRVYYLVVLAGKGIHSGLTAFYDACLYSKDRVKRDAWVKVDGENVGRVSDVFKKAYEGDDAFFDIFRNTLSTAAPAEDIEGGESEE